MVLPQLQKLRHALAAGGLGEAAAGVEDAARRRVERARHLARQDLVLARLLGHRIGQRHRGQQRLGVGVAGMGEQFVAVARGSQVDIRVRPNKTRNSLGAP